MKRCQFGRTIIVLFLLSIAACAGERDEAGTGSGTSGIGSPQRRAVETTYSLRQQVSILRDMAQRREVEADLLAREPNADQQAIARRRTLARELAAEADELE